MINYNKQLTIVTPTYNRLEKIKSCYESLCNQTNFDFLWFVVDDGSTDDTENFICDCIDKNIITIKYLKKENGGKASALNRALDQINTKFVTCLDSDDLFFPSTVDVALAQLKMIENTNSCCGILSLRVDNKGVVLGKTPIPSDIKFITASYLFLKLNLKTELQCFYKTADICKYRFPEYKNEKFVSPAWMQYAITQNQEYLVVHESMSCCEYCDDGLTKNKRKIIRKNPNGYTCVKFFSFKYSKSLRNIIKNGIMYDYGTLLSKNLYWLVRSPRKIWSLLLLPFAFCILLHRSICK